MTTRNIKSAKVTTDALVATAEEARARRKALAASKKGNETKRVAIDETESLVKEGTHVVLMHLNDQRDSLDVADEKVEEELSQLDPNYFAREETTSVVTPPENVTPAPPAVIVTVPPVQTAPTVVLEPQQAIGLPAAVDITEVRTVHYITNPRLWTLLQWVLAIVLGLIGLLIGLKTVDWIVSGWNTNWWPWVITILQWFFGIIWVVAVTTVGITLGSILGLYSPEWRRNYVVRRDEQRRVETQQRTVPPVPPVAPPAV